jgi:hypothetical protein
MFKNYFKKNKNKKVTLMSEFVELRRNPEFRSKTDLSTENPINSINRRHSVQITCGTVNFNLKLFLNFFC